MQEVVMKYRDKRGCKYRNARKQRPLQRYKEMRDYNENIETREVLRESRKYDRKIVIETK